MSRPFLSIVIPVYNECQRLNNLTHVFQYLRKQKFSSEVIVVNDGSTDTTLKLLQDLQRTYPFELVHYLPNKGKGYAIKKGMLKALGDYILFTDIDLSTPLNQFEKFQTHLKNYDIVIGTRKTQSSLLIKRQSRVRESLGKIFTWLSQVTLQVEVSDFTCGFKCFSKKAKTEVFPLLTINRWGFDSEILFIAQKRGLKIKEVPVIWENDINTKVRFPQDIFNSLKELAQIRFNDLMRRYDSN